MSHFSVLVITDTKPTKASMQETLLPWHEYESTGIERYLTWQDFTDEVKAEWVKPMEGYRSPDDRILDGHEDEFYREPTPEEAAGGRLIGMGFSDGLSWMSKDWGDGRGHRAKVHFIPPGYETTVTNQKQFYPTIGRFARKYHGYTVRADGRIGRMSNPNRKWDWWSFGGRYSGKLIVRGVELNAAPRGELDLDAMKRRSVKQRQEWADDCCEKASRPLAELDVACRIESIAKAEWETLAEPKPRGNGYRDWIAGHGGEWPILAAFQAACFELPEVPANMSLAEWIAAAPPISSWAVVADDQWFEKGRMGMWGVSWDEKRNWEEHFSDLFGIIRPEQWVSIVDCHI